MEKYLVILLVNFGFACMASFLTVAGSRSSLGKSFVKGRSKCDSCQATLPWLTMIPVLGYLLCRGKCVACHSPIALSYPVTEILYALTCSLFLYLFPIKQALWFIGIYSLLFLMAASDSTNRIVQDRWQLLLLFIIFLGLVPTLTGRVWLRRIIQAGIIAAGLTLLASLSHGGIGGADLKTLTILSLGTDFQTFNLFLLLASGLALCHALLKKIKDKRKKEEGLPFFPYMALAFPLTIILRLTLTVKGL